ncbi:MAG: type I pullulanase [Faecalibacillus sp.]
MESSMFRMVAHLIDIDKIEVSLSKNYYNGISPKFYIRDLNEKTIKQISANKTAETEKNIKYFFENIYVDLDHNYQIVDNYGLHEELQYHKLAGIEDFDKLFAYDGPLGVEYKKSRTIFRVWAPTALDVLVKVDATSYQMTRKKQGVYEVEVQGNLENCHYTFLVKHHYNYHEALDPYAYASGPNNRYNIVIDIDKVNEDLNRKYLPQMERKTDAIIYEMSVRDFTMSPSIKATYPGKFLSVVESGLKTPKGNKAGLDYLIDLGITHVQLMPIYDFATVDELYPTVMYNWGYDPMQYGLPEGSYATDPSDGYSRVKECRHMVSQLHKNGIRVIMDVVYNHMYDVNASGFERLVPGYYFRKDKDGKLSNGSWCGNDLESRRYMVRRYILDMCLRWQKLYGMDGYRFDLMGIIDIDTLNLVYDKLSDIDPHFLMYGEGWNMDTALPNSLKGMQDNHEKMLNIGFFNDRFRETLKGGSGDGSLKDKGYFSGNMYNCEISGECMKNINRYSYVDQSINYVECHDNATTFDKFAISNVDEQVATRKKRQLMLNMALLMSQGIPFLHCGQEFYRSKCGLGNTYNTLDNINAVNWSLVDENKDDIDTLKTIIDLRKNNIGFKYETIEEVKKNVSSRHFHYQILRYSVKQEEGVYKEIVAYMNPSHDCFDIDDMDGYDVIYNDNGSLIHLSPISMKIFALKR